jgi:hypothetical protein
MREIVKISEEMIYRRDLPRTSPPLFILPEQKKI